MREITVYSTVGQKASILNSDVMTWRELKGLLVASNIKYAGMKAVIGENRATIESDNATLPEGPFSLFLMPVRVKSGASPEKIAMLTRYKEMVKKGMDIAGYFRMKGTQVTRVTAEVGEEIMNEFEGGIPTPIPPKEAVVESKEEVKPEDEIITFPDSVVKEKYVTVVLQKLEEIREAVDSAAESGDMDEELASKVIDKIVDVKMIVEQGDAGIRKALEDEERLRIKIKKLTVELEKFARILAEDFPDVVSW